MASTNNNMQSPTSILPSTSLASVGNSSPTATSSVPSTPTIYPNSSSTSRPSSPTQPQSINYQSVPLLDNHHTTSLSGLVKRVYYNGIIPFESLCDLKSLLLAIHVLPLLFNLMSIFFYEQNIVQILILALLSFFNSLHSIHQQINQAMSLSAFRNTNNLRNQF